MYQLTAMSVRITGTDHARKIPWSGEAAMRIGNSANFIAPKRMFSRGTHREARSPISTES